MGTTPFPDGFFTRADPSADDRFYSFSRFVTHIDDGAIEAVGALYDELALTGNVLDLCSSWVSHFRAPPQSLVALGMNPDELAANPQATSWLVQDLNEQPELPFDDATFDAATCCVSVDYLVRPVEVFASVARVLRPGGRFVCTFSNQYRSSGNVVGEGRPGDRCVDQSGRGRLEEQDDGVATGVLRSPGRAARRPLLRLPPVRHAHRRGRDRGGRCAV